MKKAILIMCSVAALGACSQETKESLGLANTPPDEFAVVTRAPLSVPPEYTIRPPRPGAARPMEISTTDEARQTVFGVKDVRAASGSSTAPSGSFLDKVGVNKANPDIRSVVDGEEPTDNRTTAEKLLFLNGADAKSGDPIDPKEEYERLKQEGVVATKKRNEEIPAP